MGFRVGGRVSHRWGKGVAFLVFRVEAAFSGSLKPKLRPTSLNKVDFSSLTQSYSLEVWVLQYSEFFEEDLLVDTCLFEESRAKRSHKVFQI